MLAAMNERMVVIVRPRIEAERMEELSAAVERLRRERHVVDVRTTAGEGDGRRFARAAAYAGADVVVAAGGDGTLNEIVNGLGPAPHRPRLGVVPIGTANDFASGLGLPEEIGPALDAAARGRSRRVDLARVNERYFLNVSTGGFGAQATEGAPAETKRLLGAWAYVVTGAKQFSDLRPVAGRFTIDDEVLFDGRFMLFAVGNARQTGGGSMLTPRAELDDGTLDVLIVKEMPRVDFLALLPDLRAGTQLESPDVVYTRVERLLLETDDEVSVNADGEPLRGCRFEYALDPRPLDVMVSS